MAVEEETRLPVRGFTEEDHALNRSLGRNIRERREQMGFKGPTDLARKINDPRISGEYISTIERGMNGPRLTALMAIADSLKTTTAHLLGDAEHPVSDASFDRGYDAGRTQGIMEAHEAISELRRKSR